MIFSEEAQRWLTKIGVQGWATMDPSSEHFVLSQTVALADVLQYVSMDGIIKIAVELRDPEHALSFSRDGLIRGAIDACLEVSFREGMKSITEPSLADWAQGKEAQARKELADKAYPEIERRLRERVPDRELYYWDVEVPTDGVLLNGQQRSDVQSVKEVTRQVLAEIGKVPLEPFERLVAAG